jgi:hypothetical protein
MILLIDDINTENIVSNLSNNNMYYCMFDSIFSDLNEKKYSIIHKPHIIFDTSESSINSAIDHITNICNINNTNEDNNTIYVINYGILYLLTVSTKFQYSECISKIYKLIESSIYNNVSSIVIYEKQNHNNILYNSIIKLINSTYKDINDTECNNNIKLLIDTMSTNPQLEFRLLLNNIFSNIK